MLSKACYEAATNFSFISANDRVIGVLSAIDRFLNFGIRHGVVIDRQLEH